MIRPPSRESIPPPADFQSEKIQLSGPIRMAQFFKALFATAGSYLLLGTPFLVFEGLNHHILTWWDEFKTGERRVEVLTPSKMTPGAEKTERISDSVLNDSVMTFLAKMRKNPNAWENEPIGNVKNVLDLATQVKLGREDRDLLLYVSEHLANLSAARGNFDEATKIRIEAANAFAPLPDVGNIKIKGFIEMANANFRKQLISDPKLWNRLEEALNLVTAQTSLEQKNALRSIADELADRYENRHDSSSANAIRQKADQHV